MLQTYPSRQEKQIQQNKQIQQTKQIQQAKQDVLQWFYEQAKAHKLTGTAQRLWYWLFTQLSMVQPDRFYEISSRVLADELNVCLKSIERSRKVLQQAGLLHYEVRGKSVYYRLLLPGLDDSTSLAYRGVLDQNSIEHQVSVGLAETDNSNFNLISSATGDIDHTVTIMQQLTELTAKLEEYARQIAQLQIQLAEQKDSVNQASADIADTSNDTAIFCRGILDQTNIEHQAPASQDDKNDNCIMFKTKTSTVAGVVADSTNPYQNGAIFTNSKDYTACKQKQLHQPDILFNDKYEILLWDYLNKYKDNRFAEACCNHFIMVKEIYQHKGKKKLTEAGFYNIMNELEQLSGNDMTLKLAIMERSLRNRWTGFFALPDNTPEHKKAEQKKQGRKRGSYRNSYGRNQYRSHYDRLQPREGRDLSYLEQ